MGGLDKRIQALERLYSTDSGSLAQGPEGWREAMSASLERAEARDAAEEALGDLRRRVALNKLYQLLSGDESHGG